MLRRLAIESFILIKDVEIEFEDGLNVISGETGTGKSMTLSAVEFVMGKQGDYREGSAVEIVQRDMVDRFGGLEKLRREVEKLYSLYSELERELESLLREEKEIQQKREFVEFRVKEIEEIGVAAGEVEESSQASAQDPGA